MTYPPTDPRQEPPGREALPEFNRPNFDAQVASAAEFAAEANADAIASIVQQLSADSDIETAAYSSFILGYRVAATEVQSMPAVSAEAIYKPVREAVALLRADSSWLGTDVQPTLDRVLSMLAETVREHKKRYVAQIRLMLSRYYTTRHLDNMFDLFTPLSEDACFRCGSLAHMNTPEYVYASLYMIDKSPGYQPLMLAIGKVISDAAAAGFKMESDHVFAIEDRLGGLAKTMIEFGRIQLTHLRAALDDPDRLGEAATGVDQDAESIMADAMRRITGAK